MEEIAIVKRRSRMWITVLAIVLIALLVLAALWFTGDAARADLRDSRQPATFSSGSASALTATSPAGEPRG